MVGRGAGGRRWGVGLAAAGGLGLGVGRPVHAQDWAASRDPTWHTQVELSAVVHVGGGVRPGLEVGFSGVVPVGLTSSGGAARLSWVGGPPTAQLAGRVGTDHTRLGSVERDPYAELPDQYWTHLFGEAGLFWTPRSGLGWSGGVGADTGTVHAMNEGGCGFGANIWSVQTHPWGAGARAEYRRTGGIGAALVSAGLRRGRVSEWHYGWCDY